MSDTQPQSPALTANDVAEMKYNDLKAKAAELGLDASGTKEDLQARIKGHLGITDEPQGSDGSQPPAPATPPAPPSAPQAGGAEETPAAPTEAPQTPSAPAPLSESQERAETAKADRALRQSAREMKEALDRQPKVSIMIPFEAGENPENGKKVPFHCNLNGYAMDFPRGQYIEVPQQVADLIKERLESEGKIGREWRLDADSRRASALAG